MTPYLVYFESANCCGYGHHVVCFAEDASDAEDKSRPNMEEYFREQDYDQLVEERGEDEAEAAIWSTMVSCTELTPDHEDWKFVIDPVQESLYYFIGLNLSELKAHFGLS